MFTIMAQHVSPGKYFVQFQLLFPFLLRYASNLYICELYFLWALLETLHTFKHVYDRCESL